MSQPFWIWSGTQSALQKEACFFRNTVHLDAPPQKETCFFRKTVWLDGPLPSCSVRVSADTIYRFYVNGALVSRSTQKSDRYRRYYDTVDIAPYLKPGKNVLAAFACHFINDEENSRIFETGPISLQCSLRGGFIVLCDDEPGFATDRSWLVLKSDSVRFVSPHLTRYATDMLDVSLGDYPHDFAEPDFDDSGFQRATEVCDTDYERFGGVTLWPLTPATIPPLRETPIAAKRVMRGSVAGAEALLDGGAITVPPGEAAFLELDMGALTTAHVEAFFDYATDKPLTVCLSYAESYFRRDSDGRLYKGVRDDTRDAVFAGETDTLTLRSPYGCSRPMKFETVFFRTFRFIRFDFSPSTQPVGLRGLRFTEITYPLDVQADLRAPEKERALWQISLNTLRLCMHGTYEDCPYYEQMQYTMDSALQMKYTYQITGDDRLARGCIDAFSAARMPDGLVPCNAPAKFLQVIPGFALYFIEMLHDHYRYFGDKALLRQYLCVADSVLQYFARKIDGETGLFPRSDYWEFVDWVGQWHHNFGVPIGKDETVNTIYHMMFVYFLKKAAALCEAVGRTGVSAEYLKLASTVSAGVRKHCYNTERGLFLDTPVRPDASTHGQFWAVLSGIAEGEEALRLMDAVLTDDSLYQCSYSMTFYLFRALEMTGNYAHSQRYLKTWETMMGNHMTTWCEDPVTERSDCHGWSSLPLYEYANMILGVKPALPGYGIIRIEPFTALHDRADGTVATVRGPVDVTWVRDGQGVTLEAHAPEGTPVEVVLDGKTFDYPQGGSIQIRAGGTL